MSSYLSSNDQLEDLAIELLTDDNPLAVIAAASIVQNFQASMLSFTENLLILPIHSFSIPPCKRIAHNKEKMR